MDKLFGTDGIRGQVGVFPLDEPSIPKLGYSIGKAAASTGQKILIGRDTRESGEHIAHLLASGISAAVPHSTISNCGIIPTPGLSYIVDHTDFNFGIMITASHNPYTDNGLKIFGSDGEKIPGELENRIEALFYSIQNRFLPTPGELNPTVSLEDTDPLQNVYLDFLIKHAGDLTPGNNHLRLLIDCANGATYRLARQVFEKTGFETIYANVEPDGQNINRQCGAVYPGKLKEKLQDCRADLGITFDGDGDRVIFLDRRGNILDGDYILYLLARFFLATRKDFQENPVAVGTIMGNLGVEKSLQKMGLRFTRTPVGDKYVYREMKQTGSILGGEQSGHIILRSFQKTGDGILTALFFLKSLFYLDIKPFELVNQLILYPQVLKNIRVREKRDLSTWDQLNEMTRDFTARHGNHSRILLRYSGTEPIIRLMIESENQSIIDEYIEKFENFIRLTIGE